MVRIGAIQLADMKRQAAVVHDSHKKFLHQFGVVGADFLGWNLQAKAEMGATGTIQNHLHQCFIKRCHKVTEALDATPMTQRLSQSLTHGNAHILIGVVIIDMGISDGLDLQVDQTMAADLMQHVIEKGDTSAGLAVPAAIQVQTNLHVRLACDSMNLPLSCHPVAFNDFIVPHGPPIRNQSAAIPQRGYGEEARGQVR